MLTKKLTSWSQFTAANFPYEPVVDSATGKLLLPNFSTSKNTTAAKHKGRLVITSGVILNTPNLCVAYVACSSCIGFRERWLFWRTETIRKPIYFAGFYGPKLAGFERVRLVKRVNWRDLTWDEKRSICHAYHKRREIVPMKYAPVKRYKSWLTL